MKVPAAPLVVSSAVKDNDKAKEALYAFLKYYYGEEAAKISYEGSNFSRQPIMMVLQQQIHSMQ